jgi:putative hydrolase of HD superfamily
MDLQRVEQVLFFLETIDQLKAVYRASYLTDHGRKESDADHTWHACLFALLLHGESDLQPNLCRVLQLVLVHDLVEIYAGDTFAYDLDGRRDKRVREKRAADKLFSSLPNDQQVLLRDLWEEFEDARTREARFAQCMDKLQGFAQNVFCDGRTWREHNVAASMTRDRIDDLIRLDPSMAKIFEALYSRAECKRCWSADG